jgi:hypothetical protein
MHGISRGGPPRFMQRRLAIWSRGAPGSEVIPVPYSAEARVDDVVVDRAESVAEPEADARLLVGLELAAA